jgi:hypothetical protein
MAGEHDVGPVMGPKHQLYRIYSIILGYWTFKKG